MSSDLKILDCSKSFYSGLNYPDLEMNDQKLLELLCLSYANRVNHPKAYEYSKQLLLNTVKQIAHDLNTAPLSTEARLKLVARMKNLFGYLLSADISKDEIRKISGNSPKIQNVLTSASLDRIWREPITVSPNKIVNGAARKDKTAELIYSYLSINTAGEKTYMDYVSSNASLIILLPKMGKYVKIMNDNEYLGTADEITGTIVLDTYSEKNETPREEWQLVSDLVHESAHIEFFRMYINNQIPVNASAFYKEAEKYAYSKEIQFLTRLLNSPELLKKNNADPSRVFEWISFLNKQLSEI